MILAAHVDDVRVAVSGVDWLSRCGDHPTSSSYTGTSTSTRCEPSSTLDAAGPGPSFPSHPDGPTPQPPLSPPNPNG